MYIYVKYMNHSVQYMDILFSCTYIPTTDIVAYNSFIITQSITSVRIFSAYLYINSTS